MVSTTRVPLDLWNVRSGDGYLGCWMHSVWAHNFVSTLPWIKRSRSNSSNTSSSRHAQCQHHSKAEETCLASSEFCFSSPGGHRPHEVATRCGRELSWSFEAVSCLRHLWAHNIQKGSEASLFCRRPSFSVSQEHTSCINQREVSSSSGKGRTSRTAYHSIIGQLSIQPY